MPWSLRQASKGEVGSLENKGYQSELKGLLLDGWEPFAVDENRVYLRRFFPDIHETGNEVLQTYGELRAIK